MNESPTIPAAATDRKRLKTRAIAAIIVAAAVIPFAVHGARQSIEHMRIAPEKWVAESDPQRQQFEQFRRDFEGNDVVYLSWDGCTIDNPVLSQLSERLMAENQLPDNAEVFPFERILTGPDVLKTLTGHPVRLSREEALNRLSGFLVGADEVTSCAVVVLTYDGNEHRAASIKHLLNLATDVTGLTADKLVVVGPPHDGVAIDVESVRGVNIFSTGATIVAAALCCWFLRVWQISALVIGLACLGQGFVLALVHYSGMTLDAILIVSPALVFVLTVSAGIHFVNYFQQQSHDLATEQAVQTALVEGWKPCWISVLTTAFGLSSLMISGIAPVAAFGWISAAGLLFSIALLMNILPDALCKWPPARLQTLVDQRSYCLLRLTGHSVSRHAGAITISFVLCIVAALVGIRDTQTCVDVTALFAPNTKIIQDYRWIESRIGASVPVEVVVDFDHDKPVSLSGQLDTVRKVHDEVGRTDGIHGVMSAASFLRDSPVDSGAGSGIADYVVNRRLHQSLQTFDDLNYRHEDTQRASWRITGRVFATEGLSYGAIRDQLSSRLDRLLKSDGDDSIVAGIQAHVTGMMPLIDDVQMTIMQDLQKSLVTAFGLIGVSIFVILRSVRMSVLVTLLNTLPVLIVFGWMGLQAVPLDIGTMMTAGVAMGIAVDDTVHFLYFVRSRNTASGDYEMIVREGVEICGAAMLRTTVICSAAMLVFAISSFVPTRQFGLIMAAILITAVISDLICLPALLILSARRGATAVRSRGITETVEVEDVSQSALV